MSWIVLLLSGVLEAVWATALSESRGFKRIVPTVIFLVAMTVSMLGLAYAMNDIPTGTAYAVWVGVGAALTILVAIVRGQERATVSRLVLLSVLIGCVAGLKLVG